MDTAGGRDNPVLRSEQETTISMTHKIFPDLPQSLASFGPWADLPPDLLLRISNGFGLPLEFYCRVRRVCTTWRSTLPPPIPLLLTVSTADAPTNRPHTIGRQVYLYPPPPMSTMLLPAESPFPLRPIPDGAQCIGSSNGWMAAITDINSLTSIFLWNPLTDIKRISLPTLREMHVTKIVFAPNPTVSDHVAVMICGFSSLAYVKEGDLKWMIIDVDTEQRDNLVDLAYADADDSDGKTCYCVSIYGDVRMLRLPDSRRQNPVVESLEIERAGLPFDPAVAYASPYDRASKFTRLKRIFLVDGSLYQLWRNTTSAVSWSTPGGGRFRMAIDDVFVLKYDSERRPCWDKASDLGGFAVFIGKNNPVVLRPEDAAGVRANCVYWIDEALRNEPMVFDVVTGTSTLHPCASKALSRWWRPVCWYFLNDKITSVVEDSGKKRLTTSGEDCVDKSPTVTN
ncbi:hypothetical protein QOZ80_4BG0344980 [Eleusine coracana subsp. coracana]|nr:hypothetical protein QOZ80_4BG0344980 [Eleusine coracana subsp. coracana]